MWDEESISSGRRVVGDEDVFIYADINKVEKRR